ncbi:MAG: phosphoribosylformylglycinamidine synthase subunit PurQ, partial [Clostridia bacterium]|nr:phosphoribosylformylglycinamidine synthase subunit PurQ [Clostridia bacterium]
FLNSNGAEKHIAVETEKPRCFDKPQVSDLQSAYKSLVQNLNVCDKRGLSERFDSTIGAGTVLMPFGGKSQRTPVQAMVNKISTETGDTENCSFMAWGYNPEISEKSPYHGAYLAVIESVSKLIASGAEFKDVYLTFQEYFEKPMKDPKRWGKPLSALLGAYRAQMDLGIAAIGGKDSMSGSFENLDVPPTLVSFAVSTGKIKDVVSNDYKAAGHKVRLLLPDISEDGLPTAQSLKDNYKKVYALISAGKVYSAFTPAFGGIAEGVFKACLGNELGFTFDKNVSVNDIFAYSYGAIVLETEENIGVSLGEITADGRITLKGESICVEELFNAYRARLESVYPTLEDREYKKTETFSYENGNFYAPKDFYAKPKFLIPVFPGTNCEYDTAKEIARAGGDAEIFVINNMTEKDIEKSVDKFAAKTRAAQALFIPGGFSGGDEPEGSGKFIMAFMRNAVIKEEVQNLLDNRDGLIAGVCNGFQALIKLGLVPYGKITDTDENSPTLTFNTIGRHQSRLVRTRVASTKSPWLKEVNVGDVFTVPISHGEGRFLASEKLIKELAANGQVATQYVDFDESATMDIRFNPNGSAYAIEGITSKDGRILGKMGHSERIGKGLYKNVAGEYDIKLFLSAVKYFKGK